MSGNHVGRLSKLYINTGTYDTPVWLEAKRISDVEIENSAATSETDSRESPNTKTSVGNAKFGITTTYQKLRGVADSVLPLLRGSKRTGDCLDVLALDDAVTVNGATGIRGPFVVTSMNKSEQINEQESYDIEMAEGFEFDADGEIIDTVAVTITSGAIAVDGDE